MFHGTYTRTTIAITLGLLALAFFATAANAGKPPTMTQQEYAALMARSEALNKLYGLGEYGGQSRDQWLNARYGNEWTKLSANEFKTLVDLFGSDVTRMPLQTVQAAVARSLARATEPRNAAKATVARSGGFAWGDAGIGAAATVGVLLLASAAAIAVRRQGGPGRPAHRQSHA